MKLRIEERLGGGNGGEVYRARVNRSRRRVAVKRLARHHDQGHARRLRQEAAMIASLEHANLVQFLGVLEQGDNTCLVMELVEGVDLDQLLRHAPMTVAAALYIGECILRGLAYAHTHGVVHRDISPRNVLISWDGAVKLTDFGLAKREGCPPTAAAAVRGTIPYLSPEQLRGCRADGRSDLFALGVLLYQLITGRLPFDGTLPHEQIGLLVGNADIPAASDACTWLSCELDQLLAKLLAKDISARYQSAEEVLNDLPTHPSGRDELITLVQSMRTPNRKPRRLLHWASVGLAASLTALVGLHWYSDERTSAQAVDESVFAPAEIEPAEIDTCDGPRDDVPVATPITALTVDTMSIDAEKLEPKSRTQTPSDRQKLVSHEQSDT